MYISKQLLRADRYRSNPVNKTLCWLAVCLILAMVTTTGAQLQADTSEWTIYITNDNCPDYTWGLTEKQARKSFADIVRAHLDEINRTDNEEPANRNRYNMAVTQEALCFIDHYPERKAELIQRIKEGRVFVSPYLCNSLWGFQSVEGAIRTFYPARRLERDLGINFDVAEHIEQPCLPWGVASILAGCGIRWLSIAYLGYDSTFSDLKNPPLFSLEGPDGSKIRVVLDKWASSKSNYTQGAYLLRKPEAITKEWLHHYINLGKDYPLQVVLASGTHGDISPRSGGQARSFAEAIIKYNAKPGTHPKLVNATLPQFCHAVDEIQEKTPFLPTLSGCFGHSWDLWPVSLAKYVADMREGERRFLAAETLFVIAAYNKPELHEATHSERERAEWCWSMLSDHAWNGTNNSNKRHNAELRKKWSIELNRQADKLMKQAWDGLGLITNTQNITLFNNLSFLRRSLVRLDFPENGGGILDKGQILNSQIVPENNKRVLYLVSPEIAGFGFAQLNVKPMPSIKTQPMKLTASATHLESPYYRLKVDFETGGISSLIHKASGTELVVPEVGRSLCQTIYFDGNEHTLKNINSEEVTSGPVLARLKIDGTVEGLNITNFVTVYADLDHVDFDLHITKPVTTQKQRLCQVFPVLHKQAVLRVDTTGAVIRPRPQPEGDLLPGADTRRFAVQGFVDTSVSEGIGIMIAPLDAFVLRLDLDPITFEALGNDQNYREVTRDQDGVTNFRFRYSLRAHTGGYRNTEAFTWSRSTASPLLAALGKIPNARRNKQVITVDPTRAIATCLKPADGDAEGCILRLREIAGQSKPLTIGLKGYKKAVLTDLLERDIKELRIAKDKVTPILNYYGFSAIKLYTTDMQATAKNGISTKYQGN
ncbi:MAG: hypothetical protein OEW48_04750 [Phycisphaerae bacterium]|nr:hypothetical protein [Phycisphaerae bacterium]